MSYKSEEECLAPIRALPNSARGGGGGQGRFFWKKNDLRAEQDERENKCITFRANTVCR